MDIDKISVTITEDGVVTLTGTNYRDLRSLLTAASLHYHDDANVIKPLDGSYDEEIHESNMIGGAWIREMRYLIDVLEHKMAKAINPTYTTGDLTTTTRIFEYEIKNLDQTVKDKELKLSVIKQTVDTLDPVISSLTQSLAQANSALVELKRARRNR